MIAALDLRDEVRVSAPAFLAAEGVDNPDMRWKAASALIRKQRLEAIEPIVASILRLSYAEMVLKRWRQSGGSGFGPSDANVLDATIAFSRMFGRPVPPEERSRKPRPTTDAEIAKLAREQIAYEASISARQRDAAA